MRMDTDHDGRVTLAEWVAWHQTHPGRNGRQGDPARAFERIDVNHAGYITPDEMAAFAARRYARMEGGGPGDGQGPHQMGPGGNPPPQALNPQ
jgi:Ca2+-binding EF-hand superfamily protein